MKALLLICSLLLLPVNEITAQITSSKKFRGAMAEARFGSRTCMSGNGEIMAVGAPLDSSTEFYAGSVVVYRRNANDKFVAFAQVFQGEGDYDRMGSGLALSYDGTKLAIGTPGKENVEGDGSAGEITIYNLINGTWVAEDNTIRGIQAGMYLGYSLAFSADGSFLVAGAHLANNTYVDQGRVNVYENNNGTWTQRGGSIHGTYYQDKFGYSVDISDDGNTIIAGAPYNDNATQNLHFEAGQVQVHEYNGISWQLKGTPIYGGFGDLFGWAVQVSPDGSRIAMSTDQDGTNGYGAGSVKVFDYNGSDWHSVGEPIRGEEAYVYLGESIHLSDDGTSIFVGCNSSNGNNGNHSRLYKLVEGSWIQAAEGPMYGSFDGYGASVSADAFHTTAVVGAPFEDGRMNEFSNIGMAEVLTLGEEFILPVSFLSFYATLREKVVDVNWVTSSEVNNASFDVEHSTDGLHWTLLASIPGNGNSLRTSNYHYLHTNPTAGDNYYRIRQIDYDGTFSFSSVDHVVYSKGSTSTLSVYPNPSTGTAVILDVPEPYVGGVIQLYTVNGQPVLYQQASNNLLSTAGLKSGTYIIRLKSEMGLLETRLIVR